MYMAVADWYENTLLQAFSFLVSLAGVGQESF